MHHARSSRSGTDVRRRFRPKPSCMRERRGPGFAASATTPDTTVADDAPTPRRPARHRAGLGGRAKALVMVALTASFGLLTYGTYAETATRPGPEPRTQAAVHVQR
jgi:hypothetical protein